MTSSAIESIVRTVPEFYGGLDPFWKKHIESAANYAGILAKAAGADEEIVVAAAMLHDLGEIRKTKKPHNIYGAEKAEQILSTLGYPADRVIRVSKCIRTHNNPETSLNMEERINMEARIVASAAALSQLDDIYTMLCAFYELPAGAESIVTEEYETLRKRMTLAAVKIADPMYQRMLHLAQQ